MTKWRKNSSIKTSLIYKMCSSILLIWPRRRIWSLCKALITKSRRISHHHIILTIPKTTKMTEYTRKNTEPKLPAKGDPNRRRRRKFFKISTSFKHNSRQSLRTWPYIRKISTTKCWDRIVKSWKTKWILLINSKIRDQLMKSRLKRRWTFSRYKPPVKSNNKSTYLLWLRKSRNKKNTCTKRKLIQKWNQ